MPMRRTAAQAPFMPRIEGLQVCLGLVPARPKNDGTFSVVVNLPIPGVYRPIEEKVLARVKLLLCVKNSFHSEPKLLSSRHCVGRFHSGSLASITNTSSTFIALALALVAFHPVTVGSSSNDRFIRRGPRHRQFPDAAEVPARCRWRPGRSKQLFSRDPNCFHLDFGTRPSTMKASANNANPGDEQVGSITCWAG